jgi:hypothetical protein
MNVIGMVLLKISMPENPVNTPTPTLFVPKRDNRVLARPTFPILGRC